MGKVTSKPRAAGRRCAVAHLADQYDALAAAWEMADEAGENDKSDSLQLAMNSIVDAASYLTAASMKGAAFQIMGASSQADNIRMGCHDWYRQAAEQRLERLLHRAMQVIGHDLDMPNVVAQLIPWRHKSEGKQ